MEVAIVDACGSVFGYQHGSVHLYQVDGDAWRNRDIATVPPEETLRHLQELEDEGLAELDRIIDADDTVTV